MKQKNHIHLPLQWQQYLSIIKYYIIYQTYHVIDSIVLMSTMHIYIH